MKEFDGQECPFCGAPGANVTISGSDPEKYFCHECEYTFSVRGERCLNCGAVSREWEMTDARGLKCRECGQVHDRVTVSELIRGIDPRSGLPYSREDAEGLGLSWLPTFAWLDGRSAAE